MTTNKPRWWQSWIVYAVIGLLVTAGPYFGGYFWLSDFRTSTPDMAFSVRTFRYDTLRTLYGPMGWAEAHVRGEWVILSSPDNSEIYVSDWWKDISN